MGWVVIVIIIVAVFVVAATKLSKNKGAKPVEYPYRKIDIFFSPAERSFLGILAKSVGKNVQVFSKVRVADVLTPVKGLSRSDWQKAFNKISRKHFDFLLCDKRDLSILCAIELNDKSHNSKRRKDRDLFLSGACHAASFPLVQIAVQRTYNINEIQQALSGYLSDSISPRSTQEPEGIISEHRPSREVKICPKCSEKMVKKIAKRGKNTGKAFWACSAFPKCRYIEALNDNVNTL